MRKIDSITILLSLLMLIMVGSFFLKYDLFLENIDLESEITFDGSTVKSIEDLNSKDSFRKVITFEHNGIVWIYHADSNIAKGINVGDIMTFKTKRLNLKTSDDEANNLTQIYKKKCRIINFSFFSSFFLFIVLFIVSFDRKKKGYFQKGGFNYSNVCGCTMLIVLFLMMCFYSSELL